MGRKFNFAKLFATSWQRNPKLAGYPTMKAHLDAMRDGRKPGLSLFGFPISYMTERGSDYLELLELAFERGLVVVLQKDLVSGLPLQRQEVVVFVARPEELWRVPAWIALWKTALVDGQWSNAAEAQSSLLLGYSEKQRAIWLAHMQQLRATWTGATVYTLLTDEQKRRVVSLGQRCFGDENALAALTLHFNTSDYGVRPDAAQLVPRDLSLARVAMQWKSFRTVFSEPLKLKQRGVIEGHVPTRLAAEVNRTLASKVQLLTARGWR